MSSTAGSSGNSFIHRTPHLRRAEGMTKPVQRPVLVIVGPTGVGKTDVAIGVARRLGGEILSADARQVFRYMDIGTAKPTAEQRAEVPHHCLDLRDPDEYFSAGEYGKLGRSIIEDVRKREKLPIVVGGSGLYVRALVDGFFEGPTRDPVIRRRLHEEIEEQGAPALYARLEKLDPDYAATINSNDAVRIIRALEVHEISGKPMSTWFKEQPGEKGLDAVFVGLDRPRDSLYARIDKRVEEMVSEGFVDEVRSLAEMGYYPKLVALDTIGYREAFRHIRGQTTLEEMIEQIQRGTRNYAKRQLTWFRADGRVKWIDLEGEMEPEGAVIGVYGDAGSAVVGEGGQGAHFFESVRRQGKPSPPHEG